MQGIFGSQRREYTLAGSLNLTRRDALIVAGLFGISTLLYSLLGIRFDGSTLTTAMQFIDEQLLADRLLESLWYYHANPPGLNLLVGIGLKWFGDRADVFFSATFHVLGLLVAVCVYALTWKLSASRVAAAITTGALVFSPSFVLYENWLFYSFPEMAMLTISALALYQFAETRKPKWCVTFFAILAALLLTRSLFHLAWMVLIVFLLTAVLWDMRRQIAIAAAVPVLLVVLWYGKNLYYFGTFSASTWMGLGLMNITTLMIPVPDLVPLVEEGKLSKWAMVSRYEHLDVLFATQQRPPTGIPVLDEVGRAQGGFNFNYRDIPAVDRYYAADGMKVVREFPAAYVAGVFMANRLYFSPTGMNMYFSAANRAAARPAEYIANPLLSLASPNAGPMPQPHYGVDATPYRIEVNTSIPLIITWVVVLAFGYVQARRAVLHGEPDSRSRGIVSGFIVVTALYLYVVSTTLELGENYRYRFVIEPLFFVLAATALTCLVRWARGLRASSVPAPQQSG